MFPESHLEVLSAWGLLCEWVTECVYNKSWGQLIKIGLFCNIMKIFCFPFTFLLRSLISRLHVRVMWMKRGRHGAGAESQGISLPLATVNEGAPHLMGLFLKNPAHETVFSPFLSRNSWHFMVNFCLTWIIWQIGDWSWIINLGLCNRLQGCSRDKVFLVEFSQITLLREKSDLFPHS